MTRGGNGSQPFKLTVEPKRRSLKFKVERLNAGATITLQQIDANMV